MCISISPGAGQAAAEPELEGAGGKLSVKAEFKAEFTCAACAKLEGCQQSCISGKDHLCHKLQMV